MFEILGEDYLVVNFGYSHLLERIKCNLIVWIGSLEEYLGISYVEGLKNGLLKVSLDN